MSAKTSRLHGESTGTTRTHERRAIRALAPGGAIHAALATVAVLALLACSPPNEDAATGGDGVTGDAVDAAAPAPAVPGAEDAGCTGDACGPSSPTDGRKNGDETDVDCGGTVAPKCAAGKACTSGDDCASGACPSGICLSSRSCKQHFGGDTCGKGEVSDPARQHEDCCTSIPLGGTSNVRLDKYLVTAGRMRTFIEAVGPDVRGWARANADKLPKEWAEIWYASLPANEVDVVQMIGTGQGNAAYWNTPGRANGCYAKSMGGPTYWHPADKLTQWAGDEREWTKDELDTKTMNCAPRALFAAFCAWDGGRLPTWPEWNRAVRGDKTAAEWPFPWGADTNISARASYDRNYMWPLARPGIKLAADGFPVDRAYEVAAPGRFPTGNGPLGHADLLGLVETFVSGDANGQSLDFGGIRQYAFQEAYFGREPYGRFMGLKHYTSHYAVGARCARPL